MLTHADRAVVDSIIRADGAYVMSLVRYWMPSDPAVNDVYQDICLAVAKSIHNFRGDSAPRTWLFKITLRAVQASRKRHRRRGFERIATSRQSNLLPSAKVSVPPGSPSHEARAVMSQVSSLEGLDREVLFLKALGEFTWDEIAQLMRARASDSGGLDDGDAKLSSEALKKRYARLCKALRIEASAGGSAE